MCYFLRIVSPLTLSEVRSMLPAGITADPMSSTELDGFPLIDLKSAQLSRVSAERDRKELDAAGSDLGKLRAFLVRCRTSSCTFEQEAANRLAT